jgi:hypothetical protein
MAARQLPPLSLASPSALDAGVWLLQRLHFMDDEYLQVYLYPWDSADGERGVSRFLSAPDD